jgi:hypothetical protein
MRRAAGSPDPVHDLLAQAAITAPGVRAEAVRQQRREDVQRVLKLGASEARPAHQAVATQPGSRDKPPYLRGILLRHRSGTLAPASEYREIAILGGPGGVSGERVDDRQLPACGARGDLLGRLDHGAESMNRVLDGPPRQRGPQRDTVPAERLAHQHRCDGAKVVRHGGERSTGHTNDALAPRARAGNCVPRRRARQATTVSSVCVVELAAPGRVAIPTGRLLLIEAAGVIRRAVDRDLVGMFVYRLHAVGAEGVSICAPQCSPRCASGNWTWAYIKRADLRTGGDEEGPQDVWRKET